MEWCKKIELIRLGNSQYNSAEHLNKFKSYVLTNIKDFDMQGWEIFVNLSNPITDDLRADKDYWSKVYSYLTNIDTNDREVGCVTKSRLDFMKEICDAEFQVKPRPKEEDFGYHIQRQADEQPTGWLVKGGRERFEQAFIEWIKEQP